MRDRWRRRTLLEGMVAATVASSAGCTKRERHAASIPCRFVGQDPQRGHRIRDAKQRQPTAAEVVRCDVLIVGAGVAGLSAARVLKRAGVDFRIVELESDLGGTARGDAFDRSPYPLGAHYLPAPHEDQTELIALLDELGLVTGRDERGAPEWRTERILAAPLERHYYRGRWFPGLFPGHGATQRDLDQWKRWGDHLTELDAKHGADGRRLFDLPLRSSADDLRHLDRVSMSDYLDQLGIDSWRVRWTVDYACKDDYGCRLEDTSAFAGLHHHLCRGYEEVHDRDILAFPEGNFGLVTKMAARLGLSDGERLALNTAVFGIDPHRGHAHTVQIDDGRVVRYEADAIVWAAPRFILSHVLIGDEVTADDREAGLRGIDYAPWLVANLDLDRPVGGYGAPVCWDNVPIEADNLGYVVATHARPRDELDRGAVVTFYQPMTGDPTDARRRLQEGDAPTWRDHVIRQMTAMHPALPEATREVTLARWGHAMVRPLPGRLFGAALKAARASIGRVMPCSTDTSGIALFEEAFHAGFDTARRLLAERTDRPPRP